MIDTTQPSATPAWGTLRSFATKGATHVWYAGSARGAGARKTPILCEIRRDSVTFALVGPDGTSHHGGGYASKFWGVRATSVRKTPVRPSEAAMATAFPRKKTTGTPLATVTPKVRPAAQEPEARTPEARAAIAMAAEGCTCVDGVRVCRACHGHAHVKIVAGEPKPYRYKTPTAVVQAAIAAGYAKPCAPCAGTSVVPCGSCPKGDALKAELANA